MAAKKGLGKGLDSLIPKTEPKKTTAERDAGENPYAEQAQGAVMLDISRVEPNRDQPRKKFDEDALNDLAESIKQFGILQPLLVQEK